MSQPKTSELRHLENRELAGLTFIRDYLQFSFDGPSLTMYLWPLVKNKGEIFTMGRPGYRDALCDQIGKLVIHTVEEPGKMLLLHFSDGSEIEISLKEEDQRGTVVSYPKSTSGGRPSAAIQESGKTVRKFRLKE